MTLLPRFCIYQTTTSDLQDEQYDGWTVQMIWRGLCFECLFARRYEWRRK